ncbi:MAG: asparaginase [Bacteroidales bacterium]|nr:asparaginase [Bacteroidales bacterium]
MNTKRSVLLIFTGGTISMGEQPENGSLAPLDMEAIKKLIPELEMLPVNISSVFFNPMIDSSDVDPDFWITIAETIRDNYEKYDGFVILHGTDTMAYSASAVSFMLKHLTKPVVFTGSQLPLGVLRSDAKENLMSAIEVAAAYDNDRAIVPEVCLYFEDSLMRGNRTTKQSTEFFNAFESYNYPSLAKAGVHIKYRTLYIHHDDSGLPLEINTKFDTHVVILTLFPGIQESVVEAILNAPGLRAVVLESFGAGNAPRAEWLYHQLKKASDRGTIIINVSQCHIGTIEMGRYATSLNLQRAGVLSGYDMTLEATVTKLMHLLGNYNDNRIVTQMLQESICGEVTLPIS